MRIAVFGANGPTGQIVCQQALAADMQVLAVTRRPGAFPVSDPRLEACHAEVTGNDDLIPIVTGCDAVLSVLGASYGRHEITIYSVGTRRIVEAMRATSCRRLIVVSSGLTYPPPCVGWFFDHVMHPILRNVVGRTLYADMRRMEEYLKGCDDIDWTVMRPGRLVDAASVSSYRLDRDFPTQMVTTRADLAAAMLAEIGHREHLHQAWAPTTR
jgi:nucleoside-diphosphate-sugar epimerase